MSGSPTGEDAFDEFYHWNVRRVVHLVYASTGDLTLAQDCTQEAFSRAWQQGSKVSQCDDPLAWVRTVARRLAISVWRKRTNQSLAHVRLEVHASMPGPSEDRVAVMTTLRTLSGPVREAVTLHYLADLSIERIAYQTDTPAGTIKARLHRGRKQLALAHGTEECRHG